jgi:WD40 repeat protein
VTITTFAILDASMECSSVVTSSQHSVASPDGEHIATLHSTHLSVRKSTTLDLVSSIPLPTKRSQFLCLRWSPTTSSSHPSRLLLATTTAVHVYSLESPSYHATISNGSGGLGPISHAEFGADESEVLVWTALGASLCLWSIETGRMIAEWRDPKFFTNSAVIGRGCAWSGDAGECPRPAVRERGILALITRSGPQDTLTLYAPHDYAVVKTLTLPTSDAQGVKWGPNGRWLAVWDAAGMAYKVLFYTADGNLFRTYEGEHEDDDMQGLGVKKVEWSPNGTHFAISAWDSRLTLLNTRTVKISMSTLYSWY